MFVFEFLSGCDVDQSRPKSFECIKPTIRNVTLIENDKCRKHRLRAGERDNMNTDTSVLLRM